jgi:hypothetical protein
MVFPEALADEREFAAFRAAIGVPLLANMTEFGKSPLLDVPTLESLGVNVVIYPVTTLRLAMGAVEDGLRTIAQRGTQEPVVGRMQSRPPLRLRLRRVHGARRRRSTSPRRSRSAMSTATPRSTRPAGSWSTARPSPTWSPRQLPTTGYPVQELAASCGFEEVAYSSGKELLGPAELAAPRARARAARAQQQHDRPDRAPPDNCHLMTRAAR